MHRRLAAALATILLLTSIGGAAAVEPGVTVERGPSGPAASSDPLPSPSPSTEPTPTTEPSAQVEPVPTTVPSSAPSEPPPAVVPGEPAADGIADPTDRWIVLYRAGTDTRLMVAGQGKRLGFRPERTFSAGIRGFSARLDASQVEALRADPTVAIVVPDEKIELTAQSVPNGVARIGGRASTMARIDGVDQRVDADVAIVDTGIARVADLNVAGGYNCSTSDRSLWRDVQGHGTHVAGTVGAIDNGSGVVGVAPGVRLWAVKILDDSGEGLLSWYVCGLDWIAAQKDPSDPTRPRFEAVNMSVAKYGSDDKDCGATNADILHAAICRLVSSGVTVVAAAANDSSSAASRVPAAYNEVITVSALADTDGRPGALGGRLCYSWGSYDDDDSFANFSNYGSDVDLIAPGKCIWSTVPGGYKYSSGTSMAAPHVAGAVALLRATRPSLSPAEVREALQYLGNLNWKITSDPDPYHEKLLDVTRIGARGDFSLAAGPAVILGEAGGTATFPISLTRTTTSFERVVFRASSLGPGMRATFSNPTHYGFGAGTTVASITVPAGTATGRYDVRISGVEHDRVHTTTATIIVEGTGPTSGPPASVIPPRAVVGPTTLPVRVYWPAAVDDLTGVAGYEVQRSVAAGAWTGLTATSATSATGTETLGSTQAYRVRARDRAGNWGAWATGPILTPSVVQDNTSAVRYGGRWNRYSYAYGFGGTLVYSTAAGASASTTFTGRSVAIVGAIGPTRGRFRVYVNGTLVATVSATASRNQSRVALWSATWSTAASRRVELRLVGDGRVDFDGFIVAR